MKIGIVETEHFEVAYAFIRLYQLPGSSIVVFTNAYVRSQLELMLGAGQGQIEWREKKASETRFQFIRSIFRSATAEKFDQLHLCTVNNYHLVYALLSWKIRHTIVILTVHDINSLFKSKHLRNVRSFVRHMGKKVLSSTVRVFNVISETMMEELQRNLRGVVAITNLPGGLYEGSQSRQSLEHQLRIVVPGSVDGKRRNYQEVLRLAERLAELNIEAEITLLGRPVGRYGREVTETAKSFRTNYVVIKTYDDFVRPDEYSRVLKNSHFVFVPTSIHYQTTDGIIETYGRTKASGNIFDIISHAKPFIAPVGLAIPAPLASSGFQYDSIEDVLIYLKSVLASPDEYLILQQKAHNNSLHYTAEATRERNSWLFQESAAIPTTPKT